MSEETPTIRRRSAPQNELGDLPRLQTEEEIEKERSTMHRQSGGIVKVQRQVTFSPRQYHSVSVSLGFELPLEPGESPQAGAARVQALTKELLDEAVTEAIREGWKWGDSR